MARSIDGGGRAGHGDHGKESFSGGSGKAAETDRILLSIDDEVVEGKWKRWKMGVGKGAESYP